MSHRQHGTPKNVGTAKPSRLYLGDDYDSGADVDSDILKKFPAAFPEMALTVPAQHRHRNENVASLSAFSPRFGHSARSGTKAPVDTQASTSGARKRPTTSVPSQSSNSARDASTLDPLPSNPREPTMNDISRFSFASIQAQPPRRDDRDGVLEFETFLEPTFNFDDFQDNIVGTEPSLNHFPLPGRGPATKGPTMIDKAPIEAKKAPVQPTLPVPSRKGSGVASLTRKSSTASTTSKHSIKSDSVASTSILRGRRQSHFPPNAFNNANTTAKAPRKSVGPGTFIAPEATEKPCLKRRPSAGARNTSADSVKASSLKMSTSLTSQGGGARLDTSKATQAKAGPTPKRQPSKDLLTPARTPDSSRVGSTGAYHTPTKRSVTPGRTTTPGGNSDRNRRMSVMPHHATGLGARTVSPTDARRMKRLSIAPPAPPIPQSRISQAPPSPQPDRVLHIPLPDLPSPEITSRKSLTPSSSRTTPDPNRKSYSSGQSLSSNTSYSSVRNNINHLARLPETVNSSRLPTPKPRLETSTAASYELEVPPVPAIPKAYESPGSEQEQPFFSARSSSLPVYDGAISASPVVSSLADAMKALETPRAPSTSSHLSLFHAQTEPDVTVKSSKPQSTPSKKNAQSLRLPPITLLPLSTSTSAKIKSLNVSSNDRPMPITPPGMRNNTRTPSTPMTASKAAFFSRGHKANDEGIIIRSSTSHHALRSDDTQVPAISPSLLTFPFETNNDSHRTISPFISSSLPKSHDEFPSYMRPNFHTELSRDPTSAKPSGPRAPSFSLTPKMAAGPSSAAKSSENEFVSSAAAARLPVGRKVSEPRLAESASQEPEQAAYDKMPPPKLPASAGWVNVQGGTASPSSRISFLRSRRQTSSSSMKQISERQDSVESNASHIPHRPSTESQRPVMAHSNRSGSLSAKPLNITARQSSIRPPDMELDRDDMLAEEEMRKLASKRKDFEAAARELDALRTKAKPARRMSAVTAGRIFDLNIFERGEIVDYPDVFFTGSFQARKIIGDLKSAATNFGYDDERGDYNIVVGDHLGYRYEVVDLLGKGSFGQVVRCVDHKTGMLVAVKIIRNKKRFHQQALVEVNILKKLKEWDPHKKHSVVNFDQSFYFRGHLCISTDLLGMNLYEFIKAHDFRGFSLKLIRRFTKQLLQSLILLHSHKVIHCDLKPENILLAHPVHSEIKVIDFGSSCFENEKVYTYIQSRFYRSPEVILGMSYGMPIDMWSVGCILAELYTGYPIFPGENEQEQLACIMEIFGPPEKHLIEKSSRKKLFFDSMGKPRVTVSSKGKRRRPSSRDLRQVLKCDHEAFVDFIARCLRWDPVRRMNPQEAIKHEFITGVKMSGSAMRRAAQATDSPIKRVNSVANGTRPLPQPPSTVFKAPGSSRQDPSPNKVGARRQSALLSTVQGSSQAKRASHAAMTASVSNPSLTKISGASRTMSGRSDLAAAAAAASLVR